MAYENLDPGSQIKDHRVMPNFKTMAKKKLICDGIARLSIRGRPAITLGPRRPIVEAAKRRLASEQNFTREVPANSQILYSSEFTQLVQGHPQSFRSLRIARVSNSMLDGSCEENENPRHNADPNFKKSTRRKSSHGLAGTKLACDRDRHRRAADRSWNASARATRKVALHESW